MKPILIGSIASPFVRRIRMAFGEEVEFEAINVFTTEGQARLKEVSPIRRIPVLLDKDDVIWDSMLIEDYLANKERTLTVQKEMLLINEATDSALVMFQAKKFIPGAHEENTFINNNTKRVNDILNYFDQKDLAQNWGIIERWLYCTLDWINFREVIAWEEKFKNLQAFYQRNQNRSDVQATDPRL